MNYHEPSRDDTHSSKLTHAFPCQSSDTAVEIALLQQILSYLGSSTVPFAPNLGRVYSTVQICPKSSSKKVTSFVLFVPTNNRRMSSEYIIAHRICRLFWTSAGMND